MTPVTQDPTPVVPSPPATSVATTRHVPVSTEVSVTVVPESTMTTQQSMPEASAQLGPIPTATSKTTPLPAPADSAALDVAKIGFGVPPSSPDGTPVKLEAPSPQDLQASPSLNWSDLTEDSATSSDERLIIDEDVHVDDRLTNRRRDRRQTESRLLRSRSRSRQAAEDGS